MTTAKRYEYVIVGSGSAGATLARRLADAGAQVLLLEAGEPRHNHFWVRVPIGIAKIVPNKDYVWQFHTEPQQGLTLQLPYSATAYPDLAGKQPVHPFFRPAHRKPVIR